MSTSVYLGLDKKRGVFIEVKCIFWTTVRSYYSCQCRGYLCVCNAVTWPDTQSNDVSVESDSRDPSWRGHPFLTCKSSSTHVFCFYFGFVFCDIYCKRRAIINKGSWMGANPTNSETMNTFLCANMRTLNMVRWLILHLWDKNPTGYETKVRGGVMLGEIIKSCIIIIIRSFTLW